MLQPPAAQQQPQQLRQQLLPHRPNCQRLAPPVRPQRQCPRHARQLNRRPQAGHQPRQGRSQRQRRPRPPVSRLKQWRWRTQQRACRRLRRARHTLPPPLMSRTGATAPLREPSICRKAGRQRPATLCPSVPSSSRRLLSDSGRPSQPAQTQRRLLIRQPASLQTCPQGAPRLLLAHLQRRSSRQVLPPPLSLPGRSLPAQRRAPSQRHWETAQRPRQQGSLRLAAQRPLTPRPPMGRRGRRKARTPHSVPQQHIPTQQRLAPARQLSSARHTDRRLAPRRMRRQRSPRQRTPRRMRRQMSQRRRCPLPAPPQGPAAAPAPPNLLPNQHPR